MITNKYDNKCPKCNKISVELVSLTDDGKGFLMCKNCKLKFKKKHPYYNYSKITIDEKGEKKMTMLKKYICREHPTAEIAVVLPVEGNPNDVTKYTCSVCNKPAEIMDKKEADELIVKTQQEKVKKEITTEEKTETTEIEQKSEVTEKPKKTIKSGLTEEQQKEITEIKQKLKDISVKLVDLRKQKKENPSDENKTLVKNTLREMQILRQKKSDLIYDER